MTAANKGMDKKKLLIIHPTMAPYRVDLFNSLCVAFETRICLLYRIQESQLYDYSRLASQFRFTPLFLKKAARLFGRDVFMGIRKQLKTFRPDIVMVGEFGLIPLWVLLYRWCSRRRFKLVSLCDDSYNMVAEHNDFSRAHSIARRILAPRLDDIILVDPKVVQWYQERYHKGFYFPVIRDEDQARTLYESLLHSSVATAAEYGLQDRFVFLFVGRLIAIKNVNTIIKAFSRLNRVDCSLVIVGDGEEMSVLQSLAKGMNNILFTGRREGNELYQWYNIADCFVLSSYQRGLARRMLESGIRKGGFPVLDTRGCQRLYV